MLKKQEKANELRKQAENIGIKVDIPQSYKELEEKCVASIVEHLAPYPKAKMLFELMEHDPELRANWDLANFMTVHQLNYNDHGEVHAKVATSSALIMLKILLKHKLVPDFIEAGGGDLDDEHLILTAACLLHDIGNQVHRNGHNLCSVILACPLLDRLLAQIYPNLENRTEVRGFILNAIYGHDHGVQCLTTEAALVALADATDLTKGRGRMAFDLGKVDIHGVSSLAVDEVLVTEGTCHPLEIVVKMSNSAGIFQVQEILGKKLMGSPLESYVHIVASTVPEREEKDHRIVQRIALKGKRFVVEDDY